MAKQPVQPMLGVRIPKEVLDALRLAAAQRRNQDQRPYTQTEITVAALRGWLVEHGYLRRSDR